MTLQPVGGGLEVCRREAAAATCQGQQLDGYGAGTNGTRLRPRPSLDPLHIRWLWADTPDAIDRDHPKIEQGVGPRATVYWDVAKIDCHDVSPQDHSSESAAARVRSHWRYDLGRTEAGT